MVVNHQVKKFPNTLGNKPRTFVDEITEDLWNAYRGDERPWIVGFSGGKDSTMMVQLIYYAMVKLPEEERKKPIHIISSDTRVEIPSIERRVRTELDLIQSNADRDGLPISTHLVYPKLNDTFWVNLIGRGYPSPTSFFRWCTDRLKIHPVSDFIKSVVSKSGAVVVVLGARKEESTTRAQTMRAREIENQRFRPHASLPKAWVYTPMEDLLSSDVWTYLLQVPSPWGGDNKGLVALYKQASGGECPMVIDNSTPSCGNSRFGCWTCTVVKKDRSMEALVDSGEEYLEPLLDLRDYLQEVRTLPGARLDNRRNGQPAYSRNGELMTGTGPFSHHTRIDLLKRVLEAQRDSGITVIEGDELAAIQEIWCREENNRQPVDIVKRIWKHVYEDETMPGNTDEGLNQLSKEDNLLKEVCEEHGIPFDMMRRLRELEDEYGHLKRRAGLPEEMRETIREAFEQ